MGSSLTIFESAISALGTNSQALSVAGQNIANVNTPGYSRQHATLAARAPQTMGGLELGLGVSVTQITRIFDQYTERRLRDANTSSGGASARYNQLASIEGAFNELGNDGISKYMTDFFNSWHDLADDPDSIPARQNVLGKASVLIDRIHSLDTTIRNARTNIDGNIKDVVAKINTIAADIVTLNEKIKTSSSEEALTFNDQRTQKVKEMAQYVNVTAFESADGVYQVYIGEGLQLVNGTGRGTLGTAPDSTNSNLTKITFALGSGTASTVTSRLTDGEIYGNLTVRDTDLVTYQSRLNELAYQIVTKVNTVHTAGYNLNSATSKYFFTTMASSTDAARDITLSSDVSGLPKALAAADAAGSLPGGNVAALAIAALMDTTVAFTTGNNTFHGFHSDLLSRVGNDAEGAKNSAEFSQSVLDQIAAYREQVSGVSVDEEQINIVKYQAAFQAASKLVAVSKEILDTLVHLGE